jgi:hypothetical protein
MDIYELKSGLPKLYQEVFARGGNAERRRSLAADLIANARPGEIKPAVFSLGSGQSPPKAKSVRTRWLFLP